MTAVGLLDWVVAITAAAALVTLAAALVQAVIDGWRKGGRP